jgi:hypothetical protein
LSDSIFLKRQDVPFCFLYEARVFLVFIPAAEFYQAAENVEAADAVGAKKTFSDAVSAYDGGSNRRALQDRSISDPDFM